MNAKFYEHILALERILGRKLEPAMVAALAVEWEVGHYGEEQFSAEYSQAIEERFASQRDDWRAIAESEISTEDANGIAACIGTRKREAEAREREEKRKWADRNLAR